MKRFRNIIIVAMAGMLITCCGLTTVGAFTPKKTPTATATPPPTNTPKPTSGETSTKIAVPHFTPLPTNSHTPTNTQAPPTLTATQICVLDTGQSNTPSSPLLKLCTATPAPTVTLTRTPRPAPTATKAPTRKPAPTSAPAATNYDTNNDGKVTCADFQTQAQAQAAYNAGYTSLDGSDNDGQACESLP